MPELVIKQIDLERIRIYIHSVEWRVSKDGSHAYTLKKWQPAVLDDFHAFAQFIRDNGYVSWFMRLGYVCCDVDGYRYWTMGWPLEETILINRAENLPGAPHLRERPGRYLSGPEPKTLYITSRYYRKSESGGQAEG